MDCFREWRTLLNLAVPSCISVCLERWWYEIMILLCGLLLNPRATVASMGILIQTTSLIYIFPSPVLQLHTRPCVSDLCIHGEEHLGKHVHTGQGDNKLTSFVLTIKLGNCPQTTGCGVLRGTARPKVGANINLGCFYLVGMPVAMGLGVTDWAFEAQKAKQLTGAEEVVDDSEEVEEDNAIVVGGFCP
ncbi:unnamed protein product [Prunus armeniaca]|uniref:Uncharacterized protein n=1 Tax=Prunus armeniaca TaxID=36596 RepID=A0A6J5WGK9_PRUAR|nr:unnamed protein product [Prunus armeniaca]